MLPKGESGDGLVSVRKGFERGAGPEGRGVVWRRAFRDREEHQPVCEMLGEGEQEKLGL